MKLLVVLAVCCVAIAQAYPGQPGYLPSKKVVTPIVTGKGLNCKTGRFGGTFGIGGLERMSGPRGFGWIWGSDDIFDDDHDDFDLDDGYFAFLGNSGMGHLGHAMSKGGYGHAMSKGGYGHAMSKGGYGHAMGNGGYANYRSIDDIDDMSYKTIGTPVIQTDFGHTVFGKNVDDGIGMDVIDDGMDSSKTIYTQTHQVYPQVQDYQTTGQYPQVQQYPQIQQNQQNEQWTFTP